ncbi:MAG: hypothetical protein AB8D78_00115 [Akkermansiaceae bacterium]
MTQLIARVVAWLAGKLLIYALILGALLAIFVVTVLPSMVVKYHEKELELAIADLSESKELVGELAERADSISQEMKSKADEIRELNEQRERMEKLIDKIWNSVFKREEIVAEKKRIAAKEKKLLEELELAAAERRELRIEGGESEEELRRRELLLEEKQGQLRNMQKMKDGIDNLIRNQLGTLAFKALLILLALILIPFFWKVFTYYVVAPLAQNSKPILLIEKCPEAEEIDVTASHPAQRLDLEDGEVLMTKVDYLQGSMGNFDKSTKWLMDWSFPFSSLAAGLYILTQIRNTSPESGQVTLSTQENATEELAVVRVPKNRTLVFRPHYLVGVAHPVNQPPRIRSKWVFWKLHAWVNLQFRYLMVEGEARMVFSAQRGIQVEEVSPELPGRRVNSNLTVAFSPDLDYSPKRAETFVSYIWGKNALFDDFFHGSGIVIQQQVASGKRNPAARLWDSIFGAIGKVFGI